jgi:hypothetical protein
MNESLVMKNGDLEKSIIWKHFTGAARWTIRVNEDRKVCSCLGSRALPRRRIGNMSHLLFLVEVPNNDVCRMDGRHSPGPAKGELKNLRTCVRKCSEYGRL